MLSVRREESAFHPSSGQVILPSDRRIFAFLRSSPVSTVLAAVNVSAEELTAELKPGAELLKNGSGRDLLTGAQVDFTVEDGVMNLPLKPWQVCWLKLR